MINAWSLAGSVMDGTLDEDYPIMSKCKYEEDQTLELAKKYIESTYSANYTSEGSNIQTLDLIESIGDAEAFCRSNAIKYLSRYNKKGRPQDDILKAVHFCVLLYYFSK